MPGILAGFFRQSSACSRATQISHIIRLLLSAALGNPVPFSAFKNGKFKAFAAYDWRLLDATVMGMGTPIITERPQKSEYKLFLVGGNMLFPWRRVNLTVWSQTSREICSGP